MRKRNHRIWTYLNDDEYEHFLKLIKSTGASKEGFVRSLLNCNIPSPIVPNVLYDVINELRYIGNNLNQIAKVANTHGDINYAEYKKNADILVKEILSIKQEIARPTKIEMVVIENGNNKNLGNQSKCK